MKTNSIEEKERPQTAKRENKRRQIMILFIAATERLLQSEGIGGLTIRKIADATGYSSATLYSYFADLDELTLYASFKYRKPYLEEVAREITPDMTSLAQYRRLYEIFNKYSFRDPEVYLNMYFGKHSDKLKAVMDVYYQLFPEEFVTPTELIRNMLIHGRRIDCDRITTLQLAEEGYIRKENADVVAELMVRTQGTFLYQMMVHPHWDAQEQSAAFMKLFDQIIEKF